MAIRVEARGQGELRALTRALKEFGETDLRREFYRALQLAKDPMVKVAKENARSMLPSGGGAGEHVAAGLKAKTTATGGKSRNPRVRVVFSGQSPHTIEFKKARRKDVAASRRRYKESRMTPEEKAQRAETRRAAAQKGAATRRAKKAASK